MTDETTPGEIHELTDAQWEQFVRKERLLDALFLSLTFRDAQTKEAFGHPDWLQNLESVVMSNFISMARRR